MRSASFWTEDVVSGAIRHWQFRHEGPETNCTLDVKKESARIGRFFLKKTSTTPVKQHDFSYPDLMGTQESNKRFSPWLWQATRGPQPWNGDQLPLVMTMVFLCRNPSDRSIYPLFVCLCVCLSIYLSVCLSVCLPACLPACLSVCLSVCLSRVYHTHTHIYVHMLWFSCRVGVWVSWPWPTKADRRRVSKSRSVCNCNNFSVQLSFWHLLNVLSWIIDPWHALSLSGTGLAETAGMAETAEIAEIADIAGVVTVETTQHTATATTAAAVPMAALVPWSVTGDAAADHLMSPKQPRWQPG